MNNELDDLFRQQLDGHASEPGPDLWARLQARTAAEDANGAAPPAADPLDARFRAGLAGYATPPRRELWERLEDEHLQPRQRRRPVVAWGRLAVAASLLLLGLAGGAGRWWGAGRAARGPVVATTGRAAGSRPVGPRASAVGKAAAPAGLAATNAPAAATTSARALATAPSAAQVAVGERAMPAAAAGPRRAEAALLAAQTAGRQKNQKIATAQATGAGASPSSSPVASTAARRRPATALGSAPGHLPATPQPDAAAGFQLALGGRKTPGSQPTTQPETPALAAAPPQIIEVEVRRGSRPAAAAEPVVVAAAPVATEAAEPRRRLRLGGLLRQAGHALRGEPVSLADATGLPETVTVQAHLGERVLSRTIRL